MAYYLPCIFDMSFPERLIHFRKERGLTQQTLADRVGITVLQIRRYEAGTSQPTLDVIRKLAITLNVSSDALVFDGKERDPSEALRYQFEAISKLSEHEQEIIGEFLNAMIVKNEVAGAIARANFSAAKKNIK